MLYHAIYVPPGAPPPDRRIVDHPDLARYVRGWGRPHDFGWLAFDADASTPVGAAWARLFTEADPGYGYVDAQTPELSIAVLPSHRGRGIGTRLLTKLLATARTSCASISLSVSPGNPARRLYERSGFRVVGQRAASVTMKAELRD